MADDEKGAVVALTGDDCRRYLESLELGEQTVERGMAAVAAIERLLPAPAEHIFVSERREADGERTAGSLWLLGPGYMSEAFRFTTGSEFDITRVDRGVARLVVDGDRCGCEAPGARSRLAVSLNFEGRIVGMLEATGSNCRVLEGILERYLVPLLSVS